MSTSVSSSVKLETIGQRIYVAGNTYPIKDSLKSAGCHWDGDRRQWWIGATQKAKLEALVTSAQPKKEDVSDREIYSQREYKGRKYYEVGASSGRVRLASLDGSLDFWVDHSAARVIKTYEARSRFAGYSRGTVTERQTLGGLRRFVAGQNKVRGTGAQRIQCMECDTWHAASERCPDCGGC